MIQLNQFMQRSPGMGTEVATGSSGTLAAIGSSLANVGTATKAFVLAHPMGMAAVGGALLGIGAYYALGKAFKKTEAPVQTAPAAA